MITALGGANYQVSLEGDLYETEGRTRSEYEKTELTAYYHYKISRPSSGIVYKDTLNRTPYITSERSKVMNDRVLLNYWALKNAGRVLPVNPMNSIEVKKEFDPIDYRAVYLKSGQETVFEGQDLLRPSESGLLPFPLTDAEDIEWAKNEVLTKARSLVDSSSVQILVTMGELKETINMVKQAAGTLVLFVDAAKNYVDRLKALNKASKKTSQLYKDVESAWMQARFGWRPFYHEVGNIMAAVGGLRKFGDRRTFKEGMELNAIEVTDMQPFSTQYYTGVSYRKSSQIVSVSSGIFCTQRYGGVPDTFGITKVPYTIWELVPCSWLIDYYANVGNFLKSHTPDTYFTPQTNYLVVRTRTLQEITCGDFTVKAPYTGYAHGGFFRKKITEYERVDAEGIPSRIIFRLTNPGLAKTMDTVAVLRQKFASLLGVSKRLKR